MNITGLTCKSNSPSSKKTATEAVCQGLMSDMTLANDLNLIAGQGSFQKIMNKLHVFFVNTSETLPNEGWWNVESVGMPKNISIEQYQAFMAHMKRLTFPTNDHGNGSTLPCSRKCINCKCISHTVNICPLYNMKGWLGPPKPNGENQNNNPASTHQARGCPHGGGGNLAKRGYSSRGQSSGRGTTRHG
jgi:hypothetical protein